MTKQERDEVRKLARLHRPGHEHFLGCWNDNGWCAAVRSIDALEQLLAATEKMLLTDTPDKFEGIDRLFLNYINRQV